MTRTDRREEAAQHLAAIRDQKISIVRYSEISGVSLRRLRYWRKRELKEAREGRAVSVSQPTFHAIPISFSGAATYTIHVGSHRLEISRGFVAAEVMSLVSILRGA